MSHSAAHQLWCEDCRAGRPCVELLRLFDIEATAWIGLSTPANLARVASRAVEEAKPAKPRALLLDERGRLAAASKDEDERPRAGPEEDA